jgi:hypothetical protein
MTYTPEAPVCYLPLGPDPLFLTLERTMFFDATCEQIKRRSFWGILTRRRRRNTAPLLIRWCRYLRGWQRASLLHRWFVPLENTLLWYLQNTQYRRPTRSSPTRPHAAQVTKERHRLSSWERTERSQPQRQERTPGFIPAPRNCSMKNSMALRHRLAGKRRLPRLAPGTQGTPTRGNRESGRVPSVHGTVSHLAGTAPLPSRTVLLLPLGLPPSRKPIPR